MNKVSEESENKIDKVIRENLLTPESSEQILEKAMIMRPIPTQLRDTTKVTAIADNANAQSDNQSGEIPQSNISTDNSNLDK